MHNTILVCLLFLIFPINLTYAGEPLTDGAKVIVYSDGSIAEITKLVKKELKDELKKRKIKIEEKGKKGSSIADLLEKIDRDVIAKKPDLVIIVTPLAQIYDSKAKDFKTEYQQDAFLGELGKLIESVLSGGTLVTVVGPAVSGDNLDNKNAQEKIDKLNAAIQSYCEKQELAFCDLRKSALKYLEKNNPKKKDKGILSKDGVHINKDGAVVLARPFKKILGISASGIDRPLDKSDRVVFFAGDGSQWAGDHLKNMAKRIQDKISQKYAHFDKLTIPSYKIYYTKDRLFQKMDHGHKVIGQKAHVSFIQITTRVYTATKYNAVIGIVNDKITTLCKKIGENPPSENVFIMTEPIADLKPEDPLYKVLSKTNELIRSQARENGLKVFDLNQMHKDALAENPDFPIWRHKGSSYYHADFFDLVEREIGKILGLGE